MISIGKYGIFSKFIVLLSCIIDLFPKSLAVYMPSDY